MNSPSRAGKFAPTVQAVHRRLGAVEHLDIQRKQIVSWSLAGGARPKRDAVVVEEPLEIRVDTQPVCVTMRTPGHDEELAAGFLFSEAMIRRPQDIRNIARHRRNRLGNSLDVFLASDIKVDFAQLTRHVFASSSCGLCGKTTIASIHQHFPPIRSRLTLSAAFLSELPRLLSGHQTAFGQTGGLHAAAVFDSKGKLLVIREDVGRHNAVDKVLGWLLLQEKLPASSHVMLVSGRASFEIVQKALAARIPVVAAVSAPSTLAVDLARSSRQTLVGFLREGRMNVYSEPGRVRFD